RNRNSKRHSVARRWRCISAVRWNSVGGHRRFARRGRYAHADALPLHGLLDYRLTAGRVAMLRARVGRAGFVDRTESGADFDWHCAAGGVEKGRSPLRKCFWVKLNFGAEFEEICGE